MCDDRRLMREVLADPNDNIHRLVYADWCEEHGGKPALAEFIRMQVKISEYDEHYYLGFDNLDMCLKSEIADIRRSAELFHEAWGDWHLGREKGWQTYAYGSFRFSLDYSYSRFRRGFMYMAYSAKDSDWFDIFRFVLGRHPVEELKLLGYPPVKYSPESRADDSDDRVWLFSPRDVFSSVVWNELYPNRFESENAAKAAYAEACLKVARELTSA